LTAHPQGPALNQHTAPSCPRRSPGRRDRNGRDLFSTRTSDLKVTRGTEELFEAAVKSLAAGNKAYPTNISTINDIMRKADK
jgi:hypothetical protein